jgi:beta-lactamase class A
VLDAIVRRHGKVERAEIDAHFHASFLAQLPADQALKVFEQLGAQLPKLQLVQIETNQDQLIAHALASADKLRIVLELDPPSRRISGLLIEPDVEREAPPRSFDDALRAIAALAPRAQMLVAALDHGSCKPLQELAASDELAIGSTFKLYVLLAATDRVLAGKAAWSDELAVRDDWKSLPPGITQNEPPGAKHSLAELAERMIAISDNTAADHLLYTLGRRAVEAAVRSTKHAQPALDAPFLSTRELFVFRLATPAAEIKRYLALPEARRRDYLDKTLAGKDANLGLANRWNAAPPADKIEWFASSLDLCRAMAALWTRAQDPRAAAVLDILAKNPGQPLDKKLWPYVGYKGGSEPGVLNVTYLLRRSDDRWFVVTLGFNAGDGGKLDEPKLLAAVGNVIDLLGAAR